MIKFSSLLIPLFIFSLAFSANAGIYGDIVSSNDLRDQRTFSLSSYNPGYSEGGLEGFWPFSFSIAWDVSQDSDSKMWTYEYTLSATRKEVSHFIIEISDGAAQSDFSNLSANGTTLAYGNHLEGSGFWGSGQGNSNPNYPSSTDIYGIKFDTGGLQATYQLTTNRDPVWGNFYAKSGKHQGQWVHTYNNALAIEDFNSDNKIDFIVRPNGSPTVVPEPVSSILFLIGCVTLAIRHYLKN